MKHKEDSRQEGACRGNIHTVIHPSRIESPQPPPTPHMPSMTGLGPFLFAAICFIPHCFGPDK